MFLFARRLKAFYEFGRFLFFGFHNQSDKNTSGNVMLKAITIKIGLLAITSALSLTKIITVSLIAYKVIKVQIMANTFLILIKSAQILH